MPLKVGARVGPYEVLGVVGSGGMGEVYRAHDKRLHRDVAIKVLPDAMSGNEDRLARFEREARTLASLNHPNIATVYAIEEGAIVMELVAGEDLAVRLRRGPLTLAEALPIARQVTDALAAAHEARIVHRDLKPANIKIRDDGTVKVLDFGLARGASEEVESTDSADPEETLTLDGDLTAEGVVLGTAAYMAPEQAKGKAVDSRADIWAFGVVLFEMLAGRRPFATGDAADTMARVLASEPEWSALPADTPPSILRLLARCLTKDRAHRLHHIADARIELDEAAAGPANNFPWTVSRARAGVWTRWLLLPIGVVVGAGIAMTIWQPKATAEDVAYVRLDVGPAAELTSGGASSPIVLPAGGARTALAWSPDGRTLAFIGAAADGTRQIYLRDLASDSARALPGTTGAGAFTFSPNGKEIAFFADGAVRKVSVLGGPIVVLVAFPVANGITWGDTHLIASGGSLFEIPTGGGEFRIVANAKELTRFASPVLLPGDAAVLYTEYHKQWTSGDERVMVLPLSPGAVPRELIRQAGDARYLPTGHLAFLRQGTLFVVPFDAQRFELRGEPVAVLKDVGQSVVAWDSDDLTLAGQYAVSPQGAIAYVASSPATYPDRELFSVDRQGRVAALNAPKMGYRSHVEVSPDGSRLGVSIQSNNMIRAFAYDLNRGTLSRMAESLKGEVILAAWSRRNEIAVEVIDAGQATAAIATADVGSPIVPVPDSLALWAASLSVDGRLVGMREGELLVYSPPMKNARPVPLFSTRTEETQPKWSPDGKWIAYTSKTTGRSEVYVTPYPGPGEATMVSTGGGIGADWNSNGRELFYIEPGSQKDRMMAASFAATGRVGRPVELFSFPQSGLFAGTVLQTPYAVAPDGQRFYGVRDLPRVPTPVTSINLILNWFEVLKAKGSR